MGKTRFNMIKQMLEDLKLRKGEIVSTEVLQREIRMKVGDDLRTRKGAIAMMRELKLIEETEDGIKIK